MGVPQREIWNGLPEQLREMFTLVNDKGSRARCCLWPHQLGWELRLDVDGALIVWSHQGLVGPRHLV